MLYDLRMAVRTARNRPGFSFMVAGILALGIAGTRRFSASSTVLLKPLPFADSAQLVDLDERTPKWNLEYTGASNWNYYAWRNANKTFDGMTFYDSGQMRRNFTAEEDRPWRT
jgi:hypothetical protein